MRFRPRRALANAILEGFRRAAMVGALQTQIAQPEPCVFPFRIAAQQFYVQPLGVFLLALLFQHAGQVVNDVGQIGYSGPCPDAGTPHHYAITVYALDAKLGLPADTKGRQLLTAIDGHILARGQVLGAYGR